ncbi:ABC transporter permease [Leucobacter ruminantium]|uniref:ABC transporter permease n=1 Tax=Leucobacter ruminantium TaxID=1289170 RepID=A0A939LXP2_9MICO|nr:ABC transporter permease [Leucobacter ruminantium]MBO1805053.1 ABC transporter permease [Leucobacter ruminantium]
MSAPNETVSVNVASSDTKKSNPFLGWLKEQYPLFILIGLLIVAAFSTDAFFTTRNLTNLLLQVSVIGIVTLAQFLIILTGGIDISVGSVLALAGVLCAGLMNGESVLLAAVVAIAVGLLSGILTGYLVSFRGLEPFIVTLGIMALARGLVYAYTEGVPVKPAAEDFREIATTTIAGIPVLGLIWLGLAAAIWFMTTRTVFGRRIYAIGSNKHAAYASGVPVRRTLLIVYIFAGILVGFAGFLLTARIGAATPTAGSLYELDAIAAVVIGGAALSGGKGRLSGAIFGTLILGVIANLLVLLNVSAYLQDAFRGALILFAIVFTTFHVRKKFAKN